MADAAAAAASTLEWHEAASILEWSESGFQIDKSEYEGFLLGLRTVQDPPFFGSWLFIAGVLRRIAGLVADRDFRQMLWRLRTLICTAFAWSLRPLQENAADPTKWDVPCRWPYENTCSVVMERRDEYLENLPKLRQRLLSLKDRLEREGAHMTCIPWVSAVCSFLPQLEEHLRQTQGRETFQLVSLPLHQ